MKNSKIYNGFTLIEILIAIAVITILSTVIFANYHSIEKNYALKRSTSQLATDIRQVEKMVLGANNFDGKFPEGGYGIYITIRTNPIIFADIKQEGEDKQNEKYDYNEKVDEIKLEPDVEISKITDNKNNDHNIVHIIFLAPIPKIIFTDESGTDINDINEIKIKLLKQDSAKTQTIKINKVGRIEIE